MLPVAVAAFRKRFLRMTISGRSSTRMAHCNGARSLSRCGKGVGSNDRSQPLTRIPITSVSAITSRSLHVRQGEKRKALLPTLATTDLETTHDHDSKVTKSANGLEPAASRILARQLARPLTDSEIDHIIGGMMAPRDR